MPRLFALWLLFALDASANVGVGVPADHYIFDLYERLDAYGCVQPYIRTVHPQSYTDLQRAIFMPDGFECNAPPGLIEASQFLAKPTLAPFASIAPLLLQNDSITLPRLEATVTPLYPLREGRPTFSGGALYTEFYFGGATGDQFGFAYGIQPGMVLASEEYSNVLARFYLQEGFFKVSYKGFELTYGRIPMKFGDTRHGSLIFSSAMKPMSLFRLSIRPSIGPDSGAFSVLAFDSWIGSLGDSAFVANARLWATSLAWRPSKSVEWAILQAFQIGGDTLPPVQVGDYLRSFIHADDGNLDSIRKFYWASHVNAWVPSNFAKVYWQVMGNGKSGFSDVSHILGLWVPDLLKADLRFEFAQTGQNAYSDTTFTQGLVREGTPVGHPLGDDGRGFYLDIGLPLVESWQTSLHFLLEERDRSAATIEKRLGGGVDVFRRWTVTSLLISTRFATATNHNFKAIDQDIFGIHARFTYSLF